MKLSHRAALNGVELDSLDNRILIQGIDEGAGKESISAVSVYGSGAVGQRVTGIHRDTLDVTVRFALRIHKQDMAARSELFEKIIAWAIGGGWLTINYKTDRRLRVRCAQLPSAGDQRKWDSVYAITFRAFEIPYWQQTESNILRVPGVRTVTKQFGVSGSVTSVMNVEFQNTSGQVCNTFEIRTGASVFKLTSLGLANGETLIIDHTDDGLLTIGIRNGTTTRSVFNKRTVDSSDDLYVEPGIISVVLNAEKVGTLTISCAGRFAG